MAKRRTPPLFEVLSAPDRRDGPGAMLGPRPIQVQVPRPEPARPSEAAGVPRQGIHLPTSTIFLAVAAILGIVFAVWFFAFKMGEQKKLNDVKDRLIEPPKDPSGPGSPLNPQGSGGTGSGSLVGDGQSDASQPPPEPPPVVNPLADPRKPGNNYLHIVILPWKDAEKAVAYLGKSGVPAAAVPAKAVDPAEARAKNLNHLVFALEAIPSDQFRSSERRRQELIDKVRGIGSKWQREAKGPSDFGAPGWTKFGK